MQPYLNTLFVTAEGAYVAREGETLLVRVDGETRLRVPVHLLGGVVCFGRAAVSPPALGLCAKRGVGVSFLSTSGRYLARLEGVPSGNVLLRREQYRRADDPAATAALARALITAKVLNSRTVLARAQREYDLGTDEQGEDLGEPLGAAVARLADLVRDVDREEDLESLRGFEGEAARTYFQVFDTLIRAQKEDFSFRGRSRRPPLDNVNCLLSFVYTLLCHDVASALAATGLDPAVGYLHRDRPGRPSLALDLMEEFRAFLADRLVLTLINKRQLQARDFQQTESGAVLLEDAARKAVLEAWQKRKLEEIRHPYLEETVPVGLLPHLQARLLARHLRGDLDAYPPFVWR